MRCIAFKILLMGPLAQVGLALATAIGAWINLALVMWLAARAGLIGWDARLKRSVILLTAAGCVMGIVVFLATRPVGALVASLPVLRDETALVIMIVVAAVVYGGLIFALLGWRWVAGLGASAQPEGMPSGKN